MDGVTPEGGRRGPGRGSLTFHEFEQLASQAFEAIPERFREGVAGLVVSRDTEPHPSLPDVYTLGHCDTEAYLSDYDGPDTVRSVVVLYYGSFRALSLADPEFDWQAEIHETVEHEVRHHLESLAGEDELGGVDYAMDQSMLRSQDRGWDPWYYQHGAPAGRGIFTVEDQVYLEQEWTQAEFDASVEVGFRWQGRGYRIERPEELGDVHFVWISSGIEHPPPHLELVLVRKRSWWDDARRLFSSSRPRVLESEGRATPVEAS